MRSVRRPKISKGIVKRGVTELVTPGVSYNELTLETKKNNFLAAVFYGKKNIGVSFLDISTGEFLVAEGAADYVDKLLQSLSPTEVIYQKTKRILSIIMVVLKRFWKIRIL